MHQLETETKSSCQQDTVLDRCRRKIREVDWNDDSARRCLSGSCHIRSRVLAAKSILDASSSWPERREPHVSGLRWWQRLSRPQVISSR